MKSNVIFGHYLKFALYTQIFMQTRTDKHDEHFYRGTDSMVQTRLVFLRSNRGSERIMGCSGQQARPNGGFK